MSLLMSLVVVLAFALIFRKQIKRFPVVFYVLAAGVSAAGIYFTMTPNSNEVIRAAAFAVQKGHVGFAMFALVMFVGVFDKGSSVRRLFNPIRAELSIMGALLIIGHFALYLSNYLSMAAAIFSLQINLLISLCIAFVMLILLILLTVTSINQVKQRMTARTWKRVQLLAYVFFGLIFFHLFGYLIGSAMNGSPATLVNLVIYSVVFIAYGVLRVRKAVVDKKKEQD